MAAHNLKNIHASFKEQHFKNMRESRATDNTNTNTNYNTQERYV